MRLALLTFLLSLVAITPGRAAAAGPPGSTTSSTKPNPPAPQTPEELFAAGLKHYDAKQWAVALPLFRKAWQQSKSPNARLYIALCLRELGQLPEAYDEMAATVRQATTIAAQKNQYTPTRAAAANQLAILELLVGKVVIALSETVPGQKLTLNGKQLPSDRLGVPVTISPGKVTVTAQAPGREIVIKELEIQGGQTKSIALNFGPPLAPKPDGSSGGGVRIAGYVVAGLGVASMIVFGVTAGIASSDFSTLEEECGGQRCIDPSYADVVDRGKAAETASNVALAVGLAGLVSGGLMIIFGGPSQPEQTTADLVVTPQGGLFTLRGVF